MVLLSCSEGIALLQGRWWDFSIELPTHGDFGVIWLEDRVSREQW